MSVSVVEPPGINGLIDGLQGLGLSTEQDESTSRTTINIDGLEALLTRLNLNVPTPNFATADILNTPLDICRSYLAEILANILQCDRTFAYHSIQLPTDIDNGDLAVILPKLSAGADFEALGRRIVQNVRISPHLGT